MSAPDSPKVDELRLRRGRFGVLVLQHWTEWISDNDISQPGVHGRWVDTSVEDLNRLGPITAGGRS